MASRLPAGLVILVGLALLIGPVLLFPHAGQRTCSHSIEATTAAAIPSDAEVLRYRDLSPAAKRVVDDARTASDGTATVYGERCPEEFDYSDVYREYYIRTGENYYVLETVGGAGFFPGDVIFVLGFGMIGVALLGLGGHSLYRAEPAQVQEFVFGGLAGLGVLLLVLAAVNANFLLSMGLSLVTVVFAYGVLGYELPSKVGLAVAIVASAGVGLFLIGSGITGSITVLAILPLVITLLGISGRVLRSELIP